MLEFFYSVDDDGVDSASEIEVNVTYEETRDEEDSSKQSHLDVSGLSQLPEDHAPPAELDIHPFRYPDFDVNNFMHEFLLDSIAVQFHWRVFVRQFICHMIWPLMYCFTNYKAQGFGIDWDFFMQPTFVVNIFLACITYIMIITYYLQPYEDQDVLEGSFIVPLLCYVQHRLIVSLKYASFSETEYRKFQQCNDLSLAAQYTKQAQLLNNFVDNDPFLTDFELGCAAARIGAKINEITFTISNPHESTKAYQEYMNWNALLLGHLTVRTNAPRARQLIPHADGHYTVAVFDLCKAIVYRARGFSEGPLVGIIFVWVLVMISIPWIKVALAAEQWKRSLYFYITLGSGTLVLGLFGFVVLMLLRVGIWDVERQRKFMKLLHRLIRITDLTLDTDVSFKTRKESRRLREHLRENMEIILSVTKPEHKKSISIRKSLSSVKAGNHDVDVNLKKFKKCAAAVAPATEREKSLYSLTKTGSLRGRSDSHTFSSIAAADDATGSTGIRFLAEDEKNYTGDLQEQQQQQQQGEQQGEHEEADDEDDEIYDFESYHSRVQRASSQEIQRRFSGFGGKSLKNGDKAQMPQINFRRGENVIGWVYARLIFQHFADRFRNRIDTYTGGTLLLMLILMGLQLIMVITAVEPEKTFFTVFFLQSFGFVVIMWVFLLCVTTLGALANAQLHKHSRTFGAHKLRVRDEMAILEKIHDEDKTEEIEALHRTWEILEDCKDTIETYAELKPFKLFGFKVGTETVFTIFTTGLSFAGVLFSIYSTAVTDDEAN